MVDAWTDLVRCGVCSDSGVEQPLLRHGEAWSRQLRGLHLNRLALVGGDDVLRERNADQPDRYLELTVALGELQSLPSHDNALLLGALAHYALWDGVVLRGAWRQPFDFLVGAGVAVGSAPGAEVVRVAERPGGAGADEAASPAEAQARASGVADAGGLVEGVVEAICAEVPAINRDTSLRNNQVNGAYL